MSLRFVHHVGTKMVFTLCSKGKMVSQNGFLYAHLATKFLISVSLFSDEVNQMNENLVLFKPYLYNTVNY